MLNPIVRNQPSRVGGRQGQGRQVRGGGAVARPAPAEANETTPATVPQAFTAPSQARARANTALAATPRQRDCFWPRPQASRPPDATARARACTCTEAPPCPRRASRLLTWPARRSCRTIYSIHNHAMNQMLLILIYDAYSIRIRTEAPPAASAGPTCRSPVAQQPAQLAPRTLGAPWGGRRRGFRASWLLGAVSCGRRCSDRLGSTRVPGASYDLATLPKKCSRPAPHRQRQNVWLQDASLGEKDEACFARGC